MNARANEAGSPGLAATADPPFQPQRRHPTRDAEQPRLRLHHALQGDGAESEKDSTFMGPPLLRSVRAEGGGRLNNSDKVVGRVSRRLRHSTEHRRACILQVDPSSIDASSSV